MCGAQGSNFHLRAFGVFLFPLIKVTSRVLPFHGPLTFLQMSHLLFVDGVPSYRPDILAATRFLNSFLNIPPSYTADFTNSLESRSV